MTATEERSNLAAPPERNRGVRWWVAAAIAVVALAGGILVGVLVGDGDEDSSEVTGSIATQEPGDDAVDFAQRWGEALESGDVAAFRALYPSQGDAGGAAIVDHAHRAVWTDVDAAADRIVNSPLEFQNVDLVAVEELGNVFMAEYEMDVILPEEALPDSVGVVVVFSDLMAGRIGQSDIYFPMFASFVTGEIGGYPQRTADNENSWIIID